MHKVLTLLFCFLISNIAFSQIEGFHIGAGNSWSARILTFDETFTSEEKEEIKELEIPRLSYEIDLGVITRVTETGHIESGISHKWLKIGTKKFEQPDTNFVSQPNVVPSPFFIKKRHVSQNQVSFYSKYVYQLQKFKKCSLFFRGDLLLNYQGYLIGETRFDEDNNRRDGPSGVIREFNFHSTDVRLSMGGRFQIWEKYREKISLEVHLGGYGRQYNIQETTGFLQYLPIQNQRDTKGFVWEFGTKIIYSLKKRTVD